MRHLGNSEDLAVEFVIAWVQLLRHVRGDGSRSCICFTKCRTIINSGSTLSGRLCNHLYNRLAMNPNLGLAVAICKQAQPLYIKTDNVVETVHSWPCYSNITYSPCTLNLPSSQSSIKQTVKIQEELILGRLGENGLVYASRIYLLQLPKIDS
jgi:hypothetical protein